MKQYMRSGLAFEGTTRPQTSLNIRVQATRSCAMLTRVDTKLAPAPRRQLPFTQLDPAT